MSAQTTTERTSFPMNETLENCDLCIRKCGVNRSAGDKGHCRAGRHAMVYSYGPYYGEEPPLTGRHGSGTIFFSNCSMNCVYCQNFKFSQSSEGDIYTEQELARVMLELQAQGCHNINLVNPTHYVPQISRALELAFDRGLKVPIIYNTGGYDSLSTIQAMEGLVDIFLPDMKYSSDGPAEKYSGASGYSANNRMLIREMRRQKGDLDCDRGIAVKGVLIRILLLPEDISGTFKTLRFLEREFGNKVSISVMTQYYPAYRARKHKPLCSGISRDYYNRVRQVMSGLGLERGWIQPPANMFEPGLKGENLQQG